MFLDIVPSGCLSNTVQPSPGSVLRAAAAAHHYRRAPLVLVLGPQRRCMTTPAALLSLTRDVICQPATGPRPGYAASIDGNSRASREPESPSAAFRLDAVASKADLALVLRELRRRHARQRGTSELT